MTSIKRNQLRSEYNQDGKYHMAVIEFAYKEGTPKSKKVYAFIIRETEDELDNDLANIHSILAQNSGHFELIRRYEGINQAGKIEITGALNTAKRRGKPIDTESLDTILLDKSYKPSGSVTVLRVV